MHHAHWSVMDSAPVTAAMDQVGALVRGIAEMTGRHQRVLTDLGVTQLAADVMTAELHVRLLTVYFGPAAVLVVETEG